MASGPRFRVRSISAVMGAISVPVVVRASARVTAFVGARLQSENATDDPGGDCPPASGKEPDTEPHADLIEGDGGGHGLAVS